MIAPPDLRPRTTTALSEARRRLETFADLDPSTPDAARIAAFDGITVPLKDVVGWIGLFENTHPEEEVRRECEALSQELERFQTEFSLHRGAYESLAAVDLGQLDDPLAGRLAECALRRFRRAGVDRDEATRERIASLRAELVRIGQDFGRNIVEDAREYVVAGGHAALAGLPQDFLDQHPEREDGSVVLSIDPTDRMPVMQFAEDDGLRREYFLTTMQRALPANIPVLQELLRKRRELARLLGYVDWADYATEEMMTGDAATVADFLARLEVLLREPAERDARRRHGGRDLRGLRGAARAQPRRGDADARRGRGRHRRRP